MAGLTVQNFVSAATGLAVLVALCRGIGRKSTQTLGNFWVDMTRATLYGLLPLCLVMALFLVWQGVPQTFAHYVDAVTLQGVDQVIPLGPAASQIAIKQLGTNGGGFFGVNSAHPFENPTAWANLFEVSAIILIPVALVFTFGHYVKDLRQSRAILACMLALFLIGGATSLWAEYQPNPTLNNPAVEQTAPLEGKEARFGTTGTVLWSVTTTAASNGSVNGMHDSLSPLSGMVALVNMMVGEVIFGGVGAGMYGMLLNVLIAVFLAGLMIGRTPEYLGKKLQAKEVQLLVVTLMVMPIGVLVLGALASSLPGPAGAISNPGPPRVQPVALCLHLGQCQQRFGVRRLQCQHAVPQPDAGPGHVDRSLRLHPPGTGPGRQPGDEEDRTDWPEQLPHPWSAVRDPVDRDHFAGGRPDLPADTGTGPYC
jgi:K+-transporting ATPase ATPase A chain